MDFHYKTIKYLINKYDTIILPKFSQQSLKDRKDVHIETKRNMQALSHSKFRWKLITKAILSGTSVLVPSNEFKTTKVCHSCFNEQTVGDSKEYKCSTCNQVWDRDINAAVNILVRQINLGLHVPSDYARKVTTDPRRVVGPSGVAG